MADPETLIPPSPLGDWQRFTGELAGRRPVVFLDFDGTLAPIVERPQDARLPETTRQAVARLAEIVPVAVISGRGLDDVARRVDLPNLCYAGSHGFEIRTPSDNGESVRHSFGEELVPMIEEATRRLQIDLAEIEGAQVEPKRYTVAVHHRRVADTERPRVEEAVDRELARQPKLAKHEGKRVYEIRPDLDWNKGRAVTWLLEQLELDSPQDLPIYLGDDVTDEDAFAALEARGGMGVVVIDRPRPTRASWAVRSPREVRRLLDRLGEHLA